MQYFGRLEDTFAQFRGALHPNTGNRVKMIGFKMQIIDTLFV